MLRLQLRLSIAAILVALFLAPSLVLAQDDNRLFPDTGFTISDDAVWNFFNQYGGVQTFGEPVSREFTLLGHTTQLFQNAALTVQQDGSVQALQLTGEGLLPYTGFGGLTVPPADPAMAFVAPTPDQPDYSARLQIFIQSVVSDPFLSAYNANGGTSVWGLPTSGAKTDPANPNFAYQRFQGGVFFNDMTAGTTQPLPLGQFLKDVLTGQNLPADLASEAASSPLLQQYAPNQPNWLARPSELTQTDLTNAFVPDAG